MMAAILFGEDLGRDARITRVGTLPNPRQRSTAQASPFGVEKRGHQGHRKYGDLLAGQAQHIFRSGKQHSASESQFITVLLLMMQLVAERGR